MSSSDLVVYELDRNKLHQAISTVLSLKASKPAVPNLKKTTQVGFSSPLARRDFPVFLTVQYSAEDFHDVVNGIALQNTKQFILVSPTDGFCTPDCRAILAARNAVLVPLSEIVQLPGGGMPTPSIAANTMLTQFHESVLPGSGPGDGVRLFNTPPDACWSDLEIKFIYGDKVSVKVKSETKVLNCAETGMASRKNGEPTKQWDLLRDFVKGHGRLDWDNPAADRKIQNRKENLAKDLCRFFGINGDPFVYIEEMKGWEARFHIEPE